MPFCPRCHHEYEPQVRECPDCHVALVPELPSEPASEPRWVAIFQGYAPEVGMLEDILRQQGVRTLVQPADAMTRLEGSAAWPARYAQLLIPQTDLEQHREAVEEALAVVSSPPATEDEDEPPEPPSEAQPGWLDALRQLWRRR